jgi:signal transduction histidine kinase
MIVVAGLVVTLSAFQFETLVRAWVNGSNAIAESAGQQIKHVLLARLEQVNHDNSSATLSELTTQWASTVESDQYIARMLEASVGRAASIVEISITNEADHVLASSNRARRGRRAPQVRPLQELTELNALDRIRWLFSPSSDFEFRIPIGFADTERPLFTIQVLVSNVLLRAEIWPGIWRIAIAGSLALLLALYLVYVAATFTAANLKRIGAIIDRIERGEPESEPASKPTAATEFAAVESKLSLLEHKVRGAMMDAQAYKQRVNTLLERLKEAILVFDGDKLVMSAGAVESLLGFDRNAVIGHTLSEVFPAETEPGSSLHHVWPTASSIRDQLFRSNGDSSRRELLVNVDFIVDTAGAGRQLSLVRFRDARGAGELESQLQISSRLEAINRLTGGVAHEIKNPLNSISARLALLESIVADEAPEAIPEIQVISEEIYRLDRVVRTFLDFTQPLDLKRDQIDLVELAQELVQLIRPDADNRGVTIDVTGPSMSLPVRGDRDLLKQAIMNLLINALEAMPGGGQLRIVASEENGLCLLQISDTGSGIPESMRQKIFQLYFTTKKNGSGIGLATTYRTVQLHGGAIRLDSEPGRGSTFEISLPVHRVEVAAT